MKARAKNWIGALLALTAAASGDALAAGCEDPALAQALRAPHRVVEDMTRDGYRHPCETLRFFGLRRDMTVVEIWPGRGWYADILAPYLRQEGVYVAAHFNPASSSAFFRDTRSEFERRLKTLPEIFDHVHMATFDPSGAAPMAAPESVDLVLTFRNVHNWYMRGGGDERVVQAFRQMYDVLKPGGTLGIVEHRLPVGRDRSTQEDSGYMLQAEVVRLAGEAGFLLVATSEVNANPRDTADHEHGVWSLPPTLRGGESTRAYFAAIGESDRMTLRFRKPAYSLADCPARANCVSSMEKRARYRIAPFACTGDPLHAREALVRAVRSVPGAVIKAQDDERIRVEFRTRWLRFVDDAEFLLRPGQVEVRSAARLGYSDFGVNRRRIERLRAAMMADGCRGPIGETTAN